MDETRETETPRGTEGCLTTAGLFAGIGGIERGLENVGHKTVMLCECLPEAERVLRHRFTPEIYERDIRRLASLRSKKLPAVDLVSAGFPCQDLSQAGRTKGIGGQNSGLVDCLFELLSRRASSPKWVLIENVPFMLSLDRGRAMHHLVRQLESLGFRWAYRVIDTRAFGIPHRRMRVIMLASRTEDPRSVLLTEDAGEVVQRRELDTPCGFYWTEGLRGIGWAVNAVPTLKGGSTIGIPSPPAVWFPKDDYIGTPDIRDAERLQGFDPGWTAPAVECPQKRNSVRWKLVGNAVSVPVAEWVGMRLKSPTSYSDWADARLDGGSWPRAAWGEDGHCFRADVSAWPVQRDFVGIGAFLRYETRALSVRATEGFIARTGRSSLREAKNPVFQRALRSHLNAVREMDGLPT